MPTQKARAVMTGLHERFGCADAIIAATAARPDCGGSDS